MNKADLIDIVSKETNLSKACVGRVLSAMINAIGEALAAGEKANLVGFGTFELIERAARTYKHPNIGTAIKRPAIVAPKFIADPILYGSGPTSKKVTIGLISDTHDVLRPEAIAALQGSDLIVHAGNIGSSKILEELARLAPVTAVRGSDDGIWAMRLPESTAMDVGEVRLFITHSTSGINVNYATEGYDVVISGHTHRPAANVEHGVLFVSPGGRGPHRPGIGRLVIQGKELTLHVIELDVDPAI
jgi:putative phosphoesterase